MDDLFATFVDERTEGASGVKKIAVLVTVALVAVGTAAVVASTPRGALAQTSPPNVILIVVDDMRYDELDRMSAVQTQLIDPGFRFPKAFVTSSLCCPSRASILTGRYPHGTGVWNNDPNASRGSWLAFKDDERATLATALDARGYRTALVGKYFNSYNDVDFKPPGWDVWSAFVAKTIGYYGYSLTNGTTATAYGTTTADYSTDVLAAKADAFIRGTATGSPLFLMFDPYAPHEPLIPAPRHAGDLDGYTPSMPPNVAETDTSDKPAWVRRLPIETSGWTEFKRNRMELLLGVDEAVARIMQALRDTGRLSNTIVVFTSDNGMQIGSHNWLSKKAAYEESIRVPMIWRWDAAGWKGTDQRLVRNIDIAPTILQAAGATLPSVDGRSLAPLLNGTATTWPGAFAIERLGDGCSECPPTYCGVRTMKYKYVRYATGEEELYDLTTDPYEMRSLHRSAAYADVLRSMKQRARNLCSPRPPGMPAF